MRWNADILARAGATGLPAGADGLDLQAVTADSRKVRPGTVFVAVRGEKADGHDYAAQAVAAGAIAVVAERPVPAPVPVIVVPDSRLALAVLASWIRRDPTSAFHLVGITGTDGKTSTAMMLEAGFRACGLAAGLLGTVVYRFPGVSVVSNLTTPDAESLQAMFDEMRSAGVGAVAMEVSSHALDQRRVDGCWFDVALFTNLTRDHLDYHGTHEAYAAAKRRLFTGVLPASPHGKAAVLNLDDPVAPEWAAACPLPVYTYSLTRADAGLHPVRADFGLDGTDAEVATPWGTVEIRSRLIGPHNLQNQMAALGAAGVLGLPLDRFAAGLNGLDVIPGRLERVVGRRSARVFVDYAHTPKALENVLTVLRRLNAGVRLTVVMGAGGDRDRGKRPLMGQAAVRLADRVIVTSDNPRTEDPLFIIGQITGGIDAWKAAGNAAAPHVVEPDRRKAIGLAIRDAEPGEVVVIAGKGHEDYQIVGTTKHHFSDVEVAKEFLDA